MFPIFAESAGARLSQNSNPATFHVVQGFSPVNSDKGYP
jgi:hypothetical protein